MAETDDTRSSVPSVGTIAGWRLDETGTADSSDNVESQQALLSAKSESVGLQLVPDRHWTGTAMLSNEFADSVFFSRHEPRVGSLSS